MITDSVGNKLSIGDYITYPVRRGSWMETKVSKIEDIKDFDIKIVGVCEKDHFFPKNDKGEHHGARYRETYRSTIYVSDRTTKIFFSSDNKSIKYLEGVKPGETKKELLEEWGGNV